MTVSRLVEQARDYVAGLVKGRSLDPNWEGFRRGLESANRCLNIGREIGNDRMVLVGYFGHGFFSTLLADFAKGLEGIDQFLKLSDANDFGNERQRALAVSIRTICMKHRLDKHLCGFP